MMDFAAMSAQEQKDAISAFEIRKKSAPKRKDNASLRAGSAMYYYCEMCGHESDVRGEGDYSPVRHHCTPCQRMRNAGWIDTERRFVECKTVKCKKCDDGEIKERRSSFGKSYTHRQRCWKCDGAGTILIRTDTNEPLTAS